jgi:hypothetical protein
MKVTVVKEFGTNEIFAAFTNDDKPIYVGSTQMGKDWANWANAASLEPESVEDSLPANMFLEGPKGVTEELVNLFNFKPLTKSNEVLSHYEWIDSRLDGFATKALFGRARRRFGGGRRALGAPSVGKRRRGSRGDLGQSLRPNRVPPGMRAHPEDGDFDGEIYEDDPKRRRYVGFMPARESNARWSRPSTNRGAPRLGLSQPDAMFGRSGGGRRRTGRIQRLRDRLGAALDVPDSENLIPRRSTPPRQAGSTPSRQRRGSIPDTGNLSTEDLEDLLRLDVEGELTEEDKQEFLDDIAPFVGKSGILEDENGRKTAVDGFAKVGAGDKPHAAPDRVAGYNLPVEVPVGNSGINDLDGAIAALAGGSPLYEIPDDFLAEGILENSNLARTPPSTPRFKVRSQGDGVNGMMMVTDEQTGINYGLKFVDQYAWNDKKELKLRAMFGDEDINEAVGAHLAERLGAPQGQFRFATSVLDLANLRGDETPGKAILFEFAQTAVQADGLDTAYERNIRNINLGSGLTDALAMQILDFLLINPDRHDKNFLVGDEVDDNGNKTGRQVQYPIDHGGALGGVPAINPGLRQMWQDISQAEIIDGLRRYLSSGLNLYPQYNRSARAAIENATRADLVREIENLTTRLDQLDQEIPLVEAVGYLMVLSGRSYIYREYAEFVDRVQQLIEADPKEIARALQGW